MEENCAVFLHNWTTSEDEGLKKRLLKKIEEIKEEKNSLLIFVNEDCQEDFKKFLEDKGYGFQTTRVEIFQFVEVEEYPVKEGKKAIGFEIKL